MIFLRVCKVFARVVQAHWHRTAFPLAHPYEVYAKPCFPLCFPRFCKGLPRPFTQFFHWFTQFSHWVTKFSIDLPSFPRGPSEPYVFPCVFHVFARVYHVRSPSFSIGLPSFSIGLPSFTIELPSFSRGPSEPYVSLVFGTFLQGFTTSIYQSFHWVTQFSQWATQFAAFPINKLLDSVHFYLINCFRKQFSVLVKYCFHKG